MSGNLLIVESPAKAKTIEKILGPDFTVSSCFGHIRDLSKKNNGVDVENGFTPSYEVPADKKAVVKELKKLAKDTEVWLATDEDREGEAISWHLCEVLGLDPETTKRIVFHEITSPAIKKAVDNPRRINQHVVNAQQARRVLDRLVGFELSPVLWRKLGRRSLSAGRVQSVAVRLVVEREREIQAFEFQSAFRINAYFVKNGTTFKATLGKRFDKEEEANAFLEACAQAEFKISDIQVKPVRKSPAAPFTTSTLQQEASRKLSFSVGRTMSVAQRLYESGKITYMRTDSVNLSQTARDSAAAHIIQAFGEDYSNPRTFQTKDASAQEAHEAIRPTYMENSTVKAGRDEERLYELIWKRTIASQMSQALLEKTRVQIDISNRDERLVAQGEVLKFPGFLKVYIESSDDEELEEKDEEGLLPAMEVGEILVNRNFQAVQRFNRPPARYTEASLVKKLEELRIGRPSTYAPTISTVQKREYVTKTSRDGNQRNYRLLELSGGIIEAKTLTETFGAEKAKLFPTDMGLLVNDFLIEHFDRVLDYGFTAKIEREFDDIASGGTEWQGMLEGFYKPFHSEIEDTLENAERVTGERALGTDPDSGRPVIARMGRYGPMVQIGTREDEEKPRFSKLREGQSLETITFEEAMVLFEMPRSLGSYDGDEVKVNIGRYGPYVMHQKKFCSLKEDQDPYTITLEESIELILAKREEDKNKYIMEFKEEEIAVLNGRFGPYIKQGRKNFKIPKTYTAEELTLEDCQTIIATAPPKRSKKRKKK
ncbi:MAG: type I DNA topoisomerase [Bacteroidetes bacterium]|nr:type I DNA topoisomerase [Bacteroidota bacterium]